jgi:hypothetical protein
MDWFQGKSMKKNPGNWLVFTPKDGSFPSRLPDLGGSGPLTVTQRRTKAVEAINQAFVLAGEQAGNGSRRRIYHAMGYGIHGMMAGYYLGEKVGNDGRSNCDVANGFIV